MAPVKVYVNWLSAPCRAVGMVCQKLGIDVEYINVDLLKGEHLKEEFTRVSFTQFPFSFYSSSFSEHTKE